MRPLLCALLLLCGCRVRTEYRGDITKACEEEAGYDAGPQAHREACEACCNKRGFESVEPGYCSCGKLGLDGLLK